MDFYCVVCDKFVNPKSKYKHLKTSSYKKFDRCEHLELTIKNPNIIDFDEVFCAYIIQLIKQYDHYLIKCHFKLVFKDNQYSTWIKSNFFNNKNSDFLEKTSGNSNC